MSAAVPSGPSADGAGMRDMVDFIARNLVDNEEAVQVALHERGQIVELRLKVDPDEMGIGPVPAVKRLLKRTGLRIEDFDIIESNEAFAAQACAVSRELGFDPSKVNVNGGAIALGHPVGATGTILTVKTMYELDRIQGRYGLITMCIGGGQGIAMAIERI